MDNRVLNLPDVYDYEKHPASVTECDGGIYRSELEAIWAIFFKKVVYSLEYEPEENPFYGWLPEFAVRVRETDPQAVWCEVKPLYFKIFPRAIADKILKAEGDNDNDLIVAILGIEVPVLLDNLPSLGWISLRKRGEKRKWHPFSVGCVHSISYHWKASEQLVKGRKLKTVNESLVPAFMPGKEDISAKLAGRKIPPGRLCATRRINPFD
ncbi:MAG: hypothetical protein PUP92_13950 [Rhizonema sp. PD38]|nr:hypothetical protein [Rhizonema sp. PD38]